MVVLFGAERDGEPNSELDTSEGRAWITAVVVVLRERILDGGDWMWTVLCVEDALCGVEVEEMLDAELEVEWSDPEDEEPAAEWVGSWCGFIICHVGSSSLSFAGSGTGS